jgi:hypothetical protein
MEHSEKAFLRRVEFYQTFLSIAQKLVVFICVINLIAILFFNFEPGRTQWLLVFVSLAILAFSKNDIYI